MINTPSADLWAHVLLNAMLEGFYGLPGIDRHRGFTQNAQAIAFLIDEHGDWARSRRDICAALGIDEKALVARAYRVFQGEDPGDAIPAQRQGLESQRKLYREMMKNPTPEPAPKRPKRDPASPVEITVDGFLYWPDGWGKYHGWDLPKPDCKQGKVMKVATRKGGGTLLAFRNANRDWEELLRQVCGRHDLEPVYLRNGLPVPDIDGETKVFLRPRPSPSP